MGSASTDLPGRTPEWITRSIWLLILFPLVALAYWIAVPIVGLKNVFTATAIAALIAFMFALGVSRADH